MRKSNPNTIWRQELSELSSLGRRKFWLDQLVCLWCVTVLLFLAVGCTGHSLLLRVSFMEKAAMCVKDKEEGEYFQPVFPTDLPGTSEGFCYQLLPSTELQAAGSSRG